jgi:hypothetical protein
MEIQRRILVLFVENFQPSWTFWARNKCDACNEEEEMKERKKTNLYSEREILFWKVLLYSKWTHL